MTFKLENLNPCSDALDWVNTQSDYRTAWENCHRADWMLWIACELGVDERKLVAASAACARTVYHLMDDERSRKAVEVAEDFGRGEATKKELEVAAHAAYAAYAAANTDVYAAAYAAYAAAAHADADAAAYVAADAAYAAADAAAHADADADAAAYADADVYAAYAVADAAAYAYADAAAHKSMADLVRQHISFDDLGIE